MEEELPVRVNTKISYRANKWLDKKAAQMALTKSGLINLAVEKLRESMEVTDNMDMMQALERKYEEVEEFRKRLEELEQKMKEPCQ